jgi:hypothetical protein
MPVLIVTATDPAAPVGAYCTLAQARTAGAVGTDSDVNAAIMDATARVDRYTRTIFDTRALTVETDVGADGYARLPLPALTVATVAYAGLGAFAPALPTSSYQLSQALRPGDTDSLQLIAGGFGFGSLDTVVGAESYRQGGTSYARRRIVITGTFGRASVPAAVTRAAALIAAAITGGGTDGSAVNLEGDVDLPPRVPSLGGETADTTGLAEADALLRTYRRNLVRIS